MMEEAMKLARLIASKSPVATRGIKQVLDYSREHTVREGLEYVAMWNASMLRSEDILQAMTTKKPIYSKL